MDNAAATAELERMVRQFEAHISTLGDRRRKMRPSERAMAMGMYRTRINALQYAIDVLNAKARGDLIAKPD